MRSGDRDHFKNVFPQFSAFRLILWKERRCGGAGPHAVVTTTKVLRSKNRKRGGELSTHSNSENQSFRRGKETNFANQHIDAV